MALQVIKRIGRYEVFPEVGRGGMATVYLARQTDLDRFVALKELGAFHGADPSGAKRFLREARVAGSLSHPNIVTVYEYFEHDGTPYIAMEYIEHGSLRPHVGQLSLAQIGGVLEGLLAGLTHAEQHAIVHRDLKPENLMVTPEGRVKIADFGIAKATTKMQTGAFLTATGTTVGTPTYMAPEQAMAQDIGPWTDLYSVGCMAFELFTGNVPFHDSDAPMAILLRHVNEPIAPVNSIRPEVDQRISDWIKRLLVKEPAKRTQNANDAWEHFEEILLDLLGPRWRREARPAEQAGDAKSAATPLTPAPFATDQDSYESVAGGGAAAPPMYTPPPSESTPSIPEPVVGPPTPMPSQAVHAPVEPDFVTFGSPAAPQSTHALPPPAPATPPTEDAPALTAAAPPANAAPADLTAAPPIAELAESADPPASSTFETYAPLAPSLPPIGESTLAPPPGPSLPPIAKPAPTAPPAPSPQPDLRTAAADAPSLDTDTPQEAPTTARGSQPARTKPLSPALIWGLLAAGVVASGIAAAIIFGGGDSSDNPPAPGAGGDHTASAPGLSFSVPTVWKSTAEPLVPGLAPGAVTRRGPDGSGVTFGRAGKTAANASLLPDDLRRAAGADPRVTTADLGSGAQALRYAEIGISGGRTAIVYAMPTTDGVATLACLASARTCDRIASTLRITKGKPFPVGPSEKYTEQLTNTLTKLDRRVSSAAADLKKARQRSNQARATVRIAATYASAARTLGQLELSPADMETNTRLTVALKATGRAYGRAAAEGRRKDRAGFEREGRRAVAAHEGVTDALDSLQADGYKLPASATSIAAIKLPSLLKDQPTSTPTPTPTATAVVTATPTPTSHGEGGSGEVTTGGGEG